MKRFMRTKPPCVSRKNLKENPVFAYDNNKLVTANKNSLSCLKSKNRELTKSNLIDTLLTFPFLSSNSFKCPSPFYICLKRFIQGFRNISWCSCSCGALLLYDRGGFFYSRNFAGRTYLRCEATIVYDYSFRFQDFKREWICLHFCFYSPKIDDALLTWPCKTLSWLTFGHCIIHVAIPHYLLHVIFLELKTSRLIFSSGLSKKISIWAELRLFTRASKRKR